MLGVRHVLVVKLIARRLSRRLAAAVVGHCLFTGRDAIEVDPHVGVILRDLIEYNGMQTKRGPVALPFVSGGDVPSVCANGTKLVVEEALLRTSSPAR